MSYWIYLNDANGGETLPLDEPHTEGGTFALFGTAECEINVTYNYAKHFSFRELHKRTGKDTILGLSEAVERLGTDTADDYWASTPGNVGHTCAVLLEWAKQHPDGVWLVS